MARFRRYSRNYGSRRQQANYSWFPINQDLSLASPAKNKIYLVQNSDAFDFDVVCERQRGAMQLSQGAFGVLYSLVLPDIILGDKTPGDEITTLVPSPVDGNGTDDFPLWTPAYGVSGSGDEAYGDNFDSKARRKLEKDNLLSLCFYIQSSGSTVNLRVLGRCLFKWKI